jgi:hypothetical protein
VFLKPAAEIAHAVFQPLRLVLQVHASRDPELPLGCQELFRPSQARLALVKIMGLLPQRSLLA